MYMSLGCCWVLLCDNGGDVTSLALCITSQSDMWWGMWCIAMWWGMWCIAPEMWHRRGAPPHIAWVKTTHIAFVIYNTQQHRTLVCICICRYIVLCGGACEDNTVQHSATHCTRTHHISLWHIEIHCNTLQRTATHCNTLQRTATHGTHHISRPTTYRLLK